MILRKYLKIEMVEFEIFLWAIIFQVITGFIVGNINSAIWEIREFSFKFPKLRELVRT